nr:Arc family DNA-binding protein [Aurantimonas sp. DM33-3]
MGVNRTNTDQFQLRLPPGLRERIKAYADTQGRSMNAEIVRILEREFPEPVSVDEQVEELLGLVSALNETSAQEGLARLNHALLEAVDRIALGRVEGVSEEDQKKVWNRFEAWREQVHEERYHRDIADLDEEELEAVSRGRGTAKFVDPGGDLDDEDLQQ